MDFDLRALGPIFAMIAFVGICIWAFSSRRKQRFDDAAQLPFADEPSPPASRRDAAEKSE